MIDLKKIKREVINAEKVFCVAEKIADNYASSVKASTQLLESSQEAQSILQSIAANIQQKAHKHIAHIVSRCLSTVFDEPYEFKIDFMQKRGKTDARLFFLRNGMEVDPMTAAGGGVVDVCSFALRLACLSLSRPGKRKLLVLDEPFRFVSAEYRDRVRQLLEQLAEEMNIQIILVTHSESFMTGKIIDLS